MGSFLRTGTVRKKPPGSVLALYELDHREPRIEIDSLGQLLFCASEVLDVDPIVETPPFPKILFGDVPVIIHTIYGFSIAPISEANDMTGPKDWRKKIYGICIDENRDEQGHYVVVVPEDYYEPSSRS